MIARDKLREALVAAELAYQQLTMSDGSPSTRIRTNQQAADRALDVLLGLLDDEQTEVVPEFTKTRWWRVIDPEGKLWCETSSKREAHQHARRGDRIERLWSAEMFQWREVDIEMEKVE